MPENGKLTEDFEAISDNDDRALVLGFAMQYYLEAHPDSMVSKEFINFLSGHLIDPRERELFSLPPLKKAEVIPFVKPSPRG